MIWRTQKFRWMVFIRDEKIELYMHQRLFWRPSNIFLGDSQINVHVLMVVEFNFYPQTLPKQPHMDQTTKSSPAGRFLLWEVDPQEAVDDDREGSRIDCLMALCIDTNLSIAQRNTRKCLRMTARLFIRDHTGQVCASLVKYIPKKNLSKRGKSTPVAGSNCPTNIPTELQAIQYRHRHSSWKQPPFSKPSFQLPNFQDIVQWSDVCSWGHGR